MIAPNAPIPGDRLSQFHPQQLMLDHHPMLYQPEQLPFYPMKPEGNDDDWRRIMQWSQPGFYCGYPAQCYQRQGNYWAGVSLASVAKRPK